MADSLPVEIAGEQIILYADRAAFWPAGFSLLVADVHFGKDAAFRAESRPVPEASSRRDLERLAALVSRTKCERLILLGDFIHAAGSWSGAVFESFADWRRAHESLEIVLVRGNHDDRAGDPPPDWRVECFDEPLAMGPFLWRHYPDEVEGGYVVGGHIHPGYRLRGRGGQSLRLPCFVLGERRMIMPAFGGFTGLAEVGRVARDRFVLVAGDELVEV